MDELPVFFILITFIHENEENENRNILRELVFFPAQKMRGHIINEPVDLKEPPFPIDFLLPMQLTWPEKSQGRFSLIKKQYPPSPWTPGFGSARIRPGDRQIIGGALLVDMKP